AAGTPCRGDRGYGSPCAGVSGTEALGFDSRCRLGSGQVGKQDTRRPNCRSERGSYDDLVRGFDELVWEAEHEPAAGWNFSWFEGRATEARPSWGYARSLVRRVSAVDSVLDVQTGGGEVFAEVLSQSNVPRLVRATESWPP